MSISYQDFYRHSIEDPNSFWGEQAKLIDWHKPFSKVLDYSKPPFSKWFVGELTNLCYNAVDCHLEKYGVQIGLNSDQSRPNEKIRIATKSHWDYGLEVV